MSQPGADPLIGSTIAQYEILARLGGGGMGVVYKARDSKLGRHVALKFLPPQWSHDESAKQRFIREAQAASATDHRNICTIHDIGSTADGRLFIVMAFYDGQTLKQKLEAGPLEIDEALDMATQVAEGLAKAHASGVVHRDIKPGNIIVTEDAVKIVDFGLAKFADSLQLTVAGSTLGTAAYMSPEQVRGDDTTARSDVWAVGVVLYEMLAGHPPFRGGYAEAISHAIRNDAPVSLRSLRPEVPEEVEQVVFRALHKDPSIRYASGRELARALRLARGQTVSQDLLTQHVQVPHLPSPAPPKVSGRGWIGWGAVAVGLVVAMSAASWLLLRTPDRVPILVSPVINQTGNLELDGYRMALTHSLVRGLSSSPSVRVVPYARMLQALRQFLSSGTDVGSREAVEALTTDAGRVQVVALPTLLYENRAWRGRIELRDPTTAMNIVAYETDAVVSSLSKDTAHKLMIDLAVLVEEHYGKRSLASIFFSPSTPSGFSTLEAERRFEEGVSWYEDQEYAAARQAFAQAADLDPRNPLPRAWVSRAALVMRLDDEAKSAADRAAQLLTDRTAPLDRVFVEAVVGEARDDFSTTEARHRDLIARSPEDVTWVLELAAFHDRRAASRDGWAVAVKDYHEALKLDAALIRPHLELCRLYNRLQETADARQQGQLALAGYQAARWRGGEALARFCIVDTLRAGTTAERQEARKHADVALQILREIRYPYNVSRALYYAGLAAAGQSRFAEAATFWEEALESAKETGNLVLQPLLLMNLGVTNERLGNVARAVDYMGRSASLYERQGDERRAAQIQANRGTLRIAYGQDADEALADVQNALAVLQKLGDAEFEITCRTAIGAHYRYAGRYDDAERELNLGLARAKERNLDQRISTVTLALARVSFDRADYGTARSRLLGAVEDDGRAGTQALTLLGRVHARLGDFDSARANLSAAQSSLSQREDASLRLALDVAMGELAYESDRLADARTHFARAASSDNTDDDVVVWARTYLALLDAIERRQGASRSTLQASIVQAHRMGRVALETTARVFLARAELLDRRPQEARRALEDLPGVGDQGLGAELRALVHYWRGRARVAAGDRTGESEVALARRLLAAMRSSLPEPYRERFAARPDIQLVGQSFDAPVR